MEQPIEQRRDGRGVAEQLAPVVDGPIRRQQRGRAFVAAHDQLQEIFGGRVRQFAHAQVVDDQQRHVRDREDGLAGAVQRRVGQFLEQRVRFPIDDAIALVNRARPIAWLDGCCRCRWPRRGRPHAGRRSGGREFVQQGPIHLLVKVKIKAVE